MASIILGTISGALGSSLGGGIGRIFGGTLGRALGGVLDNRLLTRGRNRTRTIGPRLEELSVQTSTYGKMIPIVYGSVRIAGNIIWSRPIRETVTTSTSSSGGKGGGGKVTTTTYSYSVSLAIAICEGPITELLRVWADAKQLDLSQGTYRIYKGDEEQLPDPLIEGFEGIGSTPAYRGLAYVVIEDFPLAEFGNRIPNFTFEVRKKALFPDYNGQAVEDMIQSMIMIPGSGEFVYDTITQTKIAGTQVGGSFVQQGNSGPVNQHNVQGKANALVSLDQLRETCPNVGWIGVVVTWFGTSLDAASCVILPGVEYQTGAITSPETWSVAGFTRGTAHPITLIDGFPRYGGTPDDESLLRYLDELKDRGYNILFYPMFFMDVDNKPWRGRVTGAPTAVSSFFTKTNGFNAFVTHYANLVASRVDAFVIGSELIGLTKVTDTPGNYPAVNHLVSLAATVKGIVGSGVKVTYAADWSEYHHTDGGWYNLDPLWASPNIDFIGIDAYFPLTNEPQNGYDVQKVIDGWTSGEGYDWYYSDPERTVQSPLAPAYAWKNIEWFWNNTHINPDSSTTAWVPNSKKIWFTEYGFPSVDGATNQPNVFYDPASSESFFPHHSRGRVDFRAQRQGLAGTEAKWGGSSMIERRFVWTWDARPFPYWPDLTQVWTDGPLWRTGHWVQGKLGISSLAAIVADLSMRAGLLSGDFDVSRLMQLVEGYAITHPQTARDCIEELMAAYFFDAVESDGLIKYVPFGNAPAVMIAENDIVPQQDEKRELLAVKRAEELELPQKVNVVYLNRQVNYQPGTQLSQRAVTESREIINVSLPIVMSDQEAKIIGDVTLFNQWMQRTSYSFQLSTRHMALEPADVLTVQRGNSTHTLKITFLELLENGILRIQGVAEDASVYDFHTPAGELPPVAVTPLPLAPTRLEIMDIPALPTDDIARAHARFAAAGTGRGWRGSIVYRSEDGGQNYARLVDLNTPSVIGNALAVLPVGVTQLFDLTSSVTVSVVGDAELENASETAILNGANLALLGDEVLQFGSVTMIEPGKYTLSRFLRGRLGTEHSVSAHVAGERFVLLNSNVLKEAMPQSLFGLARLYKPVSIGATLGQTASQSFTYQAKSLKPYSPVHISALRDGSGNITLNWVRRSRGGMQWADFVDLPLNETTEAYEVEILNGVNVVRTIANLSNSSASYTAAQQITDFGGLQVSVSVRVYQLSSIVGRGYPGIATV